MLPLAWFCIGLVVCMYAALLYSELRTRAKRHVRGCPSLPYVSQALLESLIVIEPDLIVVELTDHPAPDGKGRIHDARSIPVSDLSKFLASAPQRSVFVFYSCGDEAIEWARVERIVNGLAIPSAYVLRG